MSARPRLAGDGRLLEPATVSVGRTSDGWVRGTFSIRDRDPFERTGDELLLAESFARLDLGQLRKARHWFLEHGVVDLVWMFPGLYRPGWSPRLEAFADRASDVLEQQRSVRWHLHGLARLSTERHRAQPSHGEPHPGWDPAWARVAIRAPDGRVLWLGASDRVEGRITPDMQRYARYEDVPDRKPLRRHSLEGLRPEWFTGVWWPAGHAAWQRIVREAVPVLWFPSGRPYDHWPEDEISMDRYGIETMRRIGTDWYGLMEIERRLLRPYVRRAAMHELEILPDRDADGPDDDTRAPRPYGTLEVREERRWQSLLAPVYLQLLEALRRISEGRQGAAFCRECGQPFLILDARRSAFCNDRERHRWSQRERRKRLAAPPAPLGMAG